MAIQMIKAVGRSVPVGARCTGLVFQTKEAIDFEEGTELTFTIHQFHNAADHRLAHFRISVTTDEGELPLGLPEEFAALQLARGSTNGAPVAGLVSYLEKSDAKWNELEAGGGHGQQALASR